MSTENATIEVRNRIVEIKWVSQDCDHILDNFLNKSKTHDLRFLEIARLIKTCNIFEHHNGRTWFAYNMFNGINIGRFSF